MCIILIKDNKSVLGSDTLLKSATLNPDGLGITYLDNYETISSLSSDDWGILRGERRPYIAHFRYTTSGASCNPDGSIKTHPFPIGNTGCYLYQNGSVWGLGDATEIDGEHMARILGDTNRDHWEHILELTDNRWVIVDTEYKSYDVYNEEMFIDRKDVLYSKENVIDHEIVAVYGTLKRGFSNNSVMGNSKFIASGKTLNQYPMVESGIPFVLPRKGEGHNVKVELFMVEKSQMPFIDGLEGHPHNYCRKKTPIMLEDGEIVMAWLYFYPHEGVDNGTYIEEYTRGYDPNKVSLSSSPMKSYVTTHYGYNFMCDCEDRGQQAWPYYDEYDQEYYCQTCLGQLSNEQKFKAAQKDDEMFNRLNQQDLNNTPF